MSSFMISYDWVDFESDADEPSLQATFAQISIVAGNACVTRLIDKRAKTTRDFTTVPLYPLVEWIVANWWCLFEEAEVPSRGTSSDEYRSRHALREGREGYAFPNLQLFPEGEWTRLTWIRSQAAYQPVEFLESGSDRVRTVELQQQFSELIDAVIDRLSARGIDSTWLQKEWRAIQDLGPHERAFCIAAGQLGLDPFNLDPEFSQEIIRAVQRLPSYIQTEVLKAAPASQFAAAVTWVDSGVKAIRANTTPDGRWHALRHRVTVPTGEDLPWQTGYKLARQLRDILHLNDKPSININELVDSPFPVIETDQQPPAASLDGLIGLGNSSPCCYTAKVHPNSQRFLCARGLMGFLFDKSDQTDLYSSAQTDHQQRSRAFAAEFLAPASLIQDRLSSDEIGNEEIEDIASQFKVSALVIDHQIRNHRLGKIIG